MLYRMCVFVCAHATIMNYIQGRWLRHDGSSNMFPLSSVDLAPHEENFPVAPLSDKATNCSSRDVALTMFAKGVILADAAMALGLPHAPDLPSRVDPSLLGGPHLSTSQRDLLGGSVSNSETAQPEHLP